MRAEAWLTPQCGVAAALHARTRSLAPTLARERMLALATGSSSVLQVCEVRPSLAFRAKPGSRPSNMTVCGQVLVAINVSFLETQRVAPRAVRPTASGNAERQHWVDRRRS